MKLYFASLNEYIMIWGTPIGSEGHSGRHRVAFWDTVLDGETWYFAEGQFEKRVYRPGDRIFVGKGQACGMNFTDGVWALEYARGSILPRAAPQADLDAATARHYDGWKAKYLGSSDSCTLGGRYRFTYESSAQNSASPAVPRSRHCVSTRPPDLYRSICG
jgi:hypothetical protein